ncbi:MAG: hypothetical protein JRJ19_00115, partial [Deltaproteobacteria bacterium]|nr:hypothetical protein [Deltaproteobacteria bacterium]
MSLKTAFVAIPILLLFATFGGGCSSSSPGLCKSDECAAEFEDDSCNEGICIDGECLRTPIEAEPPDVYPPCTIDENKCVLKAVCQVTPPDTHAECVSLTLRDCDIGADDSDHQRYKDRDCITSACDSDTGECVYSPIVPAPATCEDNLACVVNTACNANGECVGDSKCAGDACNDPGDPNCMEPIGLCLFEPKYPAGGGSCAPDPADLCKLGTCTAATAPYPSSCAEAGLVDCSIGDDWAVYCNESGAEYDAERCRLYRNRDCLAESCDSSTGECSYTPVDPPPAACDDNLACSLNTACNLQGQCLGDAKCTPDACNDLGDPACNEPDGSCLYAPRNPAGGDSCFPNPADLCQEGTCGPATAPVASVCLATGFKDCNAGNDWEDIYCTGGSAPDAVLCQVFRDRDCLTPGCTPASGDCTYTAISPAPASCDDALACTSNEICDVNGHCIGPAICHADDCNDLADPACLEPDGTCQYLPLYPGGGGSCIYEAADLCLLGSCSDASAPAASVCEQAGTVDCAITSEWEGWYCAGGSLPDPVKCDQFRNRDCLLGSCVPETGECSYSDNGSTAACSDGFFCTTSEVCDGAGHCAGGSLPCAADFCNDLGDPACDEDLDACNWVPSGETLCTPDSGDLCISGTCSDQGGDSLECYHDPGDPAQTVDCTIGDGWAIYCDSAGPNYDPVNCSLYRKRDCLDQTCDPATGTCLYATDAAMLGQDCDDKFFCTVNTVCDAQGDCLYDPGSGLPAQRDCESEVGPASACSQVWCDEDVDLCLKNVASEGELCFDVNQGGSWCALGKCSGLGETNADCCYDSVTGNCSGLFTSDTFPIMRDCLQYAVDSGLLPEPYDYYDLECVSVLGCDAFNESCDVELDPDWTACNEDPFCSQSVCQAGSCEVNQLTDCWDYINPSNVGFCETVYCDEDIDSCLIVADEAKLGIDCAIAGDGVFCTANEVCK